MGLRGPGSKKLHDAREKRGSAAHKRRWNPDDPRPKRVVDFLESLPITKGKLRGRKMSLLPLQRAFIEDIYAENREKRVKIAIKSEPRGNGKTGLIAGIALCHLLGPEAEERGEIYSAAIDRQQAGVMFNEMEAAILHEPDFAEQVNIQRFHKRIEVLRGPGKGSLYEALSSDARRAHGLSPTLWVYDELAQAKDRVLLDNLMTAMGKRDKALGIIISTQAATDDHPLSQLIDDAGGDDSIVVHVLRAPVEADPFDPETIEKVNPALGIFLDREDLLSEAERARRIPAFEPAFRNLRLNQRVDARELDRIVTADIWQLGDTKIDRASLAKRDCYGGLDLSGKHDLCSLVLVFPDTEVDCGFDILAMFWTPEGQLERRRQSESDQFKLWIRQEHIQAVPGLTIKFGFVASAVAELAQEFNIKAIGYDRWRIDDFKQDLDAIGCEVHLEPVGQGFKDMSPAIEYFAEKALSGLLRHGGNPVLTACVANAILVSDPAGNKKFDKDKSNKSATVRIDGAVALAMALGTAKRFIEEEEPAYDLMVF